MILIPDGLSLQSIESKVQTLGRAGGDSRTAGQQDIDNNKERDDGSDGGSMVEEKQKWNVNRQ